LGCRCALDDFGTGYGSFHLPAKPRRTGQTIAEGVENEQTVKRLREFGVDYAQGY